jgi:hypothetical protein
VAWIDEHGTYYYNFYVDRYIAPGIEGPDGFFPGREGTSNSKDSE